MKKMKTKQEFDDYMWKVYPNDDQLAFRTAMLKGYEFMVGIYDQEEKVRKEIGEKILKKMKENGL